MKMMSDRISYYGTVSKFSVDENGEQKQRKFLVISGSNDLLAKVTTSLLWDQPMPKAWTELCRLRIVTCKPRDSGLDAKRWWTRKSKLDLYVNVTRSWKP